MPKNEGGRPLNTGTNSEPVLKEAPPTYAELNINKKDASVWQFMAEHEGGGPVKTPAEIEGVSGEPATYKDLGINYKSELTYSSG